MGFFDRKKVPQILERGMTVAELREALEGIDDDAKVVFVCDYGDYSHTQQALPVKEVLDGITQADLAPSGYSQSGLAFKEPDEDRDEDRDDEEDSDDQPNVEDSEGQTVVVLRM